MTIKAIVRGCSIESIKCLETNHLDFWFYENIYVNGVYELAFLNNFNESIIATDEYNAIVEPRPVDTMYFSDTYNSVATYKRTFPETVSVEEMFSWIFKKTIVESVAIDDVVSKNMNAVFGDFDYSLGSVELGTRELNPGNIGIEDFEISITEEFSMVLV